MESTNNPVPDPNNSIGIHADYRVALGAFKLSRNPWDKSPGGMPGQAVEG